MQSLASLAFARNRRLIQIADTARARSLKAWQSMDFAALDKSWATVAPTLVQQTTAAQLEAAKGSDRFTSQVATQTPGFTPTRSALVPEAFAGVDGQGRDVEGILYGAVTTTKEAVGSGLGRIQSLEAGATYLAAILKTVIGDMARSADLVSSAGKGYTYYVRVCNGSACSRCAMLVGIRSGEDAFLRHVSCQCSSVPVYSEGRPKAPAGMYSTPEEYFESLSEAQQDRAFTKAGAEAIRSGAGISEVVSARRGAKGIGYSHAIGFEKNRGAGNRLVKTTIGRRRDGTLIQVYATTEGTTVRGAFGKMQRGRTGAVKLGNDRYSTARRVRLMPETIMEIAGPDLKVRQAFLRDAGYLEYRPAHGYDSAGKWIAELDAQRRADRILVNKATFKYGKFYLG